MSLAEAEATALARIAAALPDGQAGMYLLGQKYLDALPQITQGKGTTIFLPAEASGVMGALGGLREVLSATSRAAAGGDKPTSTPTLPRAKDAASLGYPGAPRALGDGSDS